MRSSRLILCFLLCPLSSASGQVELDMISGIRCGQDPISICPGDFDSDGRLDFFVLATRLDSRLLVADGTGGFDVRPVPFIEYANSAVAADFNGDGFLDVAAAKGVSSAADGIHLALGDGQGGLASPVHFPTEGFFLPNGLGQADLDSNGRVDLFFRSFDCVGVVLNDPVAGLQPPIRVEVGSRVEKAVVSDWDGDGHPDLILVAAGSLVYLRGNGDGTFLEPEEIPTSGSVLDICPGHFDADPDIDLGLVLLPSASNPLRILLGDGSGGVERQVLLRNESGTMLRAGDLNGDGFTDLVVEDRRVDVYTGDGSGDFADVLRHAVPNRIRSLEVIDLDDDGRDEVVALSQAANEAYVLHGDGAGSLDTYRVLSLLRAPYISMADFDEDGAVDLLAADLSGTGLVLRRGDGEGGFHPATSIPLQLGFFARIRNVGVGDVDADGYLDVVVSFDRTALVACCRGDGAGGFSGPIYTALDLQPRHSLLGDFDGDGLLDYVSEHADHEVRVHRGRGDGTFISGAPITETPLSYEPRPHRIGDLDGDGRSDMLILGKPSQYSAMRQLSVVLTRPGGEYLVVQEFVSPSRFQGDLEDLDGDGRLDFIYVVAESLFSRVGIGDGTFGVRVHLRDGVSEARLHVADLDGVGAYDLVSSSSPGDEHLHFLTDGGSGTLSLESSLRLEQIAINVAVADLDSDGLDDILVSHGGGAIWALMNRTRSFGCRVGTVDAGSGEAIDVLFVNDSAGDPPRRDVRIRTVDPLRIRLDATPRGGNRYAVYAWPVSPGSRDVSPLFPGVGSLCLPIPFHDPPPRLLPRAIWRTIDGYDALLGVATHPSGLAPTDLIVLPRAPRAGVFFVQGVMIDPGAPGGNVAVTNGIFVHVE